MAPNRESQPLAALLQSRRGHCSIRIFNGRAPAAVKVPAALSMGFSPAIVEIGENYVIRGRAHSWVEV
jgi:hypothetical protein